MMDIWRWSMLQILYLVEYADYDSQKILGQGVVSDSNKKNTGGCDSLKMKSGCLKDDQKSDVIYRGIENIFGNLNQFCDGINFYLDTAYVCTDPTKYESDKYDSPYTKIGSTFLNHMGGFLKKVSYYLSFPELQLGIETGGSDNTYIPDDINIFQDFAGGQMILLVGGSFSYGKTAGLWSMTANTASDDLLYYRLLSSSIFTIIKEIYIK